MKKIIKRRNEMSGFVFRNRMLKIDIAGTEFEIEIDAKNNELLGRFKTESVATGKAYQTGEKTEGEAIELFKGYINDVLKDECAFDKIFSSRTPDLRDCMDVLTYIVSRIADFNQKNVPAVNQKVVPIIRH